MEVQLDGFVTLVGPGGSGTYLSLVTKGMWESYSPSMLQYGKGGIGIGGQYYGLPGHPLGIPHGIPKYGVLPWYDYEWMASRGWRTTDYNISKNINIRWRTNGPGRPGNLSSGIAVYCQQGQFDCYSYSSGGGIYNYGSHKKGSMGGCNALLGDLHVEWVPGTQIGW